MSNKKTLLSFELIFTLLVIVLFVWLRMRLIDISFERDEGEYAYAGQQLLKGALPYRDFYNMKMPGTYFSYAVIFTVFGESVRSVHIGLMIINLLSASFIFLAARKLFDRTVALYSAAIYLLFTISVSAQGWTANAEQFVILPAMIGLWASVEGRVRNSLIWYILSGFMMACAMICKQQGIGFIFLIPFWHLLADFDKGEMRAFFKKYLTQMSLYALGAATAFGCLLTYLSVYHIYDAFIYWTFDYASAYVSQETPVIGIWRFRPIFWDAFGFWILFFATLYFTFKRKEFVQNRALFLAFLTIGYICISMGWYYRPHYFQLLFPLAAIVCGYGLSNISKLWTVKWINTQRWAAISLMAYCVLNFGYLFYYSPDKILFNEYGDSYFSEWRRLGETLPNVMDDKGGKIALLGAEPQIMFHSKKESASGFMYHYPFYEKHKYAPEMRERYIREVEENKPEILIYQKLVEDEENNPETNARMIEWFNKYKQEYQLIGRMYFTKGQANTVWFNSDSLTAFRHNPMADIYRRKDVLLSQNIDKKTEKNNIK